MYKVKVYENKKEIATHWYEEDKVEEAENAAFALHNHPCFKYKTVFTHEPNAKVGKLSKR